MAWKSVLAAAATIGTLVAMPAARATVVSDTSQSDWMAHVSGTAETTTFSGFNPAAGGLAWTNAQPENTIPLALGTPISFAATTGSSITNGAVFSVGNVSANWTWGWSSNSSPVNIASGLPNVTIGSPKNYGFGFYVNSQGGTGTVGLVPVTVQINFSRGSQAPIDINLTLNPNGPAQFVGYYGDLLGQVTSIDITDSSTAGGCSSVRTGIIPCPVGVGDFFQATATAVPEPASIAVLGIALATLGLARRARRN